MTAVLENVHMRWRNYILVRDGEFSSFWKAHFAERTRSVLFVCGKGFDPRTCIALRTIAELANGALTETMALVFDESEGTLTQDLREKAASNWKEMEGLIVGKGLSTSHKITFRTADGRRVGARNAADVFKEEARISTFSDIIVDISAMPRSVYFPLIARLIYFYDELKRKQKPAPNIYVVVAEDPVLDCQIREEGIDETASFLHPFEGEFNREATGQQPKVWIPVLGEGRTTQFDRIYDLVKPDEVCPVLPSPSRNPRRGDDIVMEYRDLLFDQLRLDPRNIIYSSEYNPFEVYRQIRKAAIQYHDVLGLIGGCKIALSALCSKLMSLGVLLVGYELKAANSLQIGIAHIECQGYDMPDSVVPNPQPVGLWLAGECYG
ncbi:MAG TPA: hypothetical protein VN688_27300 [Gemmataceae bacterium]|nr:hypothetical protein [Gemmataceae bacterium]